MRNLVRNVSLVCASALLLPVLAQAQTKQKAKGTAPSRTAAPVAVNVMPGYPNAPNTDPDEKRQVRPGATLICWGNANNGDGSAVGASYTWSFSANPDVMVNDDGNLSGTVTDDNYIYEEVSFTLLNASTLEDIAATLTVDNGGGDVDSDTVEIRIIDPTDPNSTAPLDNLQIDVNIAIQDGLRYLYLSQGTNGSWPFSSSYDCAATGYALWAIHNQQHLPTNDPTQDIMVKTSQAGLDFLFGQAAVHAGGTFAANADVARGATAAQVTDLNSNGRAIDLCPGETNYSHPIAAAGIISSLSDSSLVNTGAFAGETVKTVIEDAVDYCGHTMNAGAGTLNYRGGWNYIGPSTRSDMSINSWMYVALEGAEAAFGIPVPDWIKQEAEHSLVFHQTNAAGSQPFGYDSASPLFGATNGQATTGGGLSGLVLAETVTTVPVGAVIGTAPAPLNTIGAKRTAALSYLGDVWSVTASSSSLGYANRGNFYAMWTQARGLRLTADALAVEKVVLTNGGVDFDWETGETLNPAMGNVPGAGDPREGYFNYLVRTQDTASGPTTRGRWSQGTYLNSYNPVMESALAVLILTPEVFLTACPTFEKPTPANGAVIPVSALQKVTVNVAAQDFNAGDTVTLTALNLPPGASFNSTPGNPATGTLCWTPGVNQLGDHTITFEASDGTTACPPTATTVTIRVAECFALLSTGQGNQPFSAGHTWQTQLSGIQHTIPVLMEEPGKLSFRIQLSDLVPLSQVNGFGANQQTQTPLAEGCAQVVMWNPAVFPTNPEQWSHGLKVSVYPNGQVAGTLYGTKNGIDIQVTSTLQPNGDIEIVFPFQVEGM